MRSEAAANEALAARAKGDEQVLQGWMRPSAAKRAQKPLSWWQRMLSKPENR